MNIHMNEIYYLAGRHSDQIELLWLFLQIEKPADFVFATGHAISASEMIAAELSKR